MENEFFSMLLNFDSGSFQSVPDIVRQNPPNSHHHHHHDVVTKNLQNSTQMSNVTKNLLTQNQISFNEVNDVNADSNNYPLDMQFPNILRTNDKVEKKSPKKNKSAPKETKTRH